MEGEVQVRDIFKKDITIKIGAVLIAILFWLYVYNNANPFTTTTFRNIPLKIENQASLSDNGYIIKNVYKNSIDITIRGRQDAIDKVRSTDFEATLDFSQIKSLNDTSIKISYPYCSQKDVVVESFQPGTIDIQLARNKSNNFHVELVNNITLKPGYKLLKTVLNPETITIVNEEALIDSVGSIKAVIDTKDLDRNVVKKVGCKVYNVEGKEITGIRNLSVDVSVEVAKEVPVTLVTKGKPAADYVETLGLVTPDTVLITGPPDQLAQITDLKTEPIDIENIKQDLNVTPVIKLPAGIKFAETQKDIAASITVEKLGLKDMSVSKNDIRLINTAIDGSLNYEILTESIALQLKGRISDLDGIRLDTILPSIDAAGLTEGTHRLPLGIILPPQVKLMQDAFIEVKIVKAENPPV
jgi:YbbR domain-containing protein